MNVCKNCGVELEKDMICCPLCGTPAGERTLPDPTTGEPLKGIPLLHAQKEEKYHLQRVLWQVTSILLFSGIISTLIINWVTSKAVTWSIYPVTLCLILFFYLSLFSFWHTKIRYQLLAGWLLSTVLLAALNQLFPRIHWFLQLAVPLLGAVNLVALLLFATVHFTRQRGVNVIAYTFVALAVLCLAIEGIISFYERSALIFQWSIIVGACLLPVIAALLFMHFRTRKNSEMEKFFHT